MANKRTESEDESETTRQTLEETLVNGATKQAANLERGTWQPGQSGNPAGRPKDTPLVTPAVRRMLQQYTWGELQALAQDKKRREALPLTDFLALNVIMAALNQEYGLGDRKLVMDRIDGKQATESIQVDARQIVIRQYGGIDPEEIS
jgi:hypothetical protein